MLRTARDYYGLEPRFYGSKETGKFKFLRSIPLPEVPDWQKLRNLLDWRSHKKN